MQQAVQKVMRARKHASRWQKLIPGRSTLAAVVGLALLTLTTLKLMAWREQRKAIVVAPSAVAAPPVSVSGAPSAPSVEPTALVSTNKAAVTTQTTVAKPSAPSAAVGPTTRSPKKARVRPITSLAQPPAAPPLKKKAQALTSEAFPDP
jgi:hypothetical protein